jgi:sucrose-6-phosphate hydrolase SacC (GH32 family)
MATPGMPFNQMMGLPVELTLHMTEEGPRLFANPVKEHASLIWKTHSVPPQSLRPGHNPLSEIKGELLDVTADLICGDTSQLGFDLRGVEVDYDTQKQELSCKDKKALLKPVNGKIRLRLLVDRTSVDIFAGDGRVYMPMGVIVPAENHSIVVFAKGGSARIDALEVRELRSAWQVGE